MIVSIILAFIVTASLIALIVRSWRAEARSLPSPHDKQVWLDAIQALRGDEPAGWKHERYIQDYNWLMAQRQLCAPLGQAESWANSKPPARTAAESVKLIGERAQRKADAERQRKLRAQLAYYEREGIEYVALRTRGGELVKVDRIDSPEPPKGRPVGYKRKWAEPRAHFTDSTHLAMKRYTHRMEGGE